MNTSHLSVACALVGVLCATPVWAIKKCTGSDGRVTYQEMACPRDAVETRTGLAPSPDAAAPTIPNVVLKGPTAVTYAPAQAAVAPLPVVAPQAVATAPTQAPDASSSGGSGFLTFAAVCVGGVLLLKRFVKVSPQRRSTKKAPHAANDPFDILGLADRGDFDGARRALQKLAYEIDKTGRPEQISSFTHVMVQFTKIDPLFAKGVQAIIPLIERSPGIRQTRLYPRMDMSDEDARYVLYFAQQRSIVGRRKAGNSYEVFLPHQVAEQEVDQAPARPARRRRTKRIT